MFCFEPATLQLSVYLVLGADCLAVRIGASDSFPDLAHILAHADLGGLLLQSILYRRLQFRPIRPGVGSPGDLVQIATSLLSEIRDNFALFSSAYRAGDTPDGKKRH